MTDALLYYADVPTVRPIVVDVTSFVNGAALAGAPPVAAGAGAPVVGAVPGAAAPPSFFAGVPPIPPYAYFSFFSAGLRIYINMIHTLITLYINTT